MYYIVAICSVLCQVFISSITVKFMQTSESNKNSLQVSKAFHKKLSLEDSGYEIIANTRQQVLDTIINFNGHEHVVFFFADKEFRNEVLEKFFKKAKSEKAPGLFYYDTLDTLPTSNQLKYDELIDSDNIVDLSKVINIVSEIHSKNLSGHTTRVSAEDCAWFLEKGFFEEHNEFERILGTFLSDNITCMCPYDATKVGEEYFGKIIRYYGYIIFDNPFCIFKLKNIQD